jgi:hypothetical protein
MSLDPLVWRRLARITLAGLSAAKSYQSNYLGITPEKIIGTPRSNLFPHLLMW